MHQFYDEDISILLNQLNKQIQGKEVLTIVESSREGK